MDKRKFDRLIQKFQKQMSDTQGFWKGMESLLPQYEKLKTAQDPKSIRKVAQLCEKMQAIQAKVENLWKPYRRSVGACTKCGGTRMPAVMGKRKGLGCFNSNCYHFEVIKKQAS